MPGSRRCIHCDGPGPFARVASRQDQHGDISGSFCQCEHCAASLGEEEFRRQVLAHTHLRVATRRLRGGEGAKV